MKALIVPKVTVKLSTNSANNNPIPSSIVAIVVSKNIVRTLVTVRGQSIYINSVSNPVLHNKQAIMNGSI